MVDFVPSVILFITEFAAALSRENKSAGQNPSTINPSTSFEAMMMIAALITNRNSTKVKKVTGMVNRIKRGVTIVLSSANTNTRIMALQNPDIETPGMILDKSITIIAEPRKRIIVLIEIFK